MPTAKQSISRKFNLCDCGTIAYKEAWDFQHQIFDLRVKNDIADTFIFVEHPHTYTLGKTADSANLIFNNEQLQKKGITVFNIDRGGDITYHGPGQIVGYPIIKLSDWKQDTHLYLRGLEEIIIRTCSHFGLETGRKEGLTGVWIENRKIAAIGIKVSRWVTMHGFAFNINTDLDLFNGIIPCGIKDKEVTSLKKELGKHVEMNDVKEILVKEFVDFFEYNSFDSIEFDQLKNFNKELKVNE